MGGVRWCFRRWNVAVEVIDESELVGEFSDGLKDSLHGFPDFRVHGWVIQDVEC